MSPASKAAATGCPRANRRPQSAASPGPRARKDPRMETEPQAYLRTPDPALLRLAGNPSPLQPPRPSGSPGLAPAANSATGGGGGLPAGLGASHLSPSSSSDPRPDPLPRLLPTGRRRSPLESPPCYLRRLSAEQASASQFKHIVLADEKGMSYEEAACCSNSFRFK